MKTNTNIAKETKQKIALNYSIEKTESQKTQLLKLANELSDLLIDTAIKINNVSLEEMNDLIYSINVLKSEKIKYSFISDIIRDNGNINVIRYPFGISADVNNDNFTRIYFESENFDKTSHVTLKNFDYSLFENKDFLIDLTFKKKYDEYNQCCEDFKNNLQIAYTNCYELIKNIRTLERIREKFIEVDKYIPDVIEVKQNVAEIKDRFNSL